MSYMYQHSLNEGNIPLVRCEYEKPSSQSFNVIVLNVECERD